MSDLKAAHEAWQAAMLERIKDLSQRLYEAQGLSARILSDGRPAIGLEQALKEATEDLKLASDKFSGILENWREIV